MQQEVHLMYSVTAECVSLAFHSFIKISKYSWIFLICIILFVFKMKKKRKEILLLLLVIKTILMSV